MAKRNLTGMVTPSVLDRLIDEEPKQTAEAPRTAAQSMRDFKGAVRRDLEWLLNTRRTIEPVPPSARETARSVYHYGLADLSSKSKLSSKDQADLVRDIESALAIFEPRLKRVKVRMEPIERGSRNLQFVIEGLLSVDPAPEPVRFDTVLEIGRGEYKVQGESVA